MIYFDNAATTLHKPDCVTDAVIAAMKNAGNPGRGAYDASMNASRLVFHARQTAAKLLGAADPSRIAFTKNVTEALNIAIGCLPEGAHVITSVAEHNSVLRPLYRLEEEKGIQLSFLGAGDDGCLKYDELPDLLRPDTRAIVITHASNVTGRITDLKRIAAFAQEHDLLLIVDGAQAAGAVPVHIDEYGIDIYCFTGHKGLMGPQGTGGLYIRKGLEEEGKINLRALMVGGSGVHSFDHRHPAMMPTALEAGTLNTHGIAGLDAGMQYVLDISPEKILQHEQMLAARFISKTYDIDGIRYEGWTESEIEDIVSGAIGCPAHTGIVSLNIGDEDAAWIADALWEEGEICVRAGAHCAPLIHEHFGTKEQGIVRFSFSWFNTEEEIDEAADVLHRILI